MPNFVQNFDNDTDFTYDSALAEFDSGIFKQKDQAPVAALLWATYTTDIDLSYSLGDKTGTGVNNPTIDSSKLNLKGDTVKYVDYDITGSGLLAAQKGALKITITPNYTGSPSTIKVYTVGCRADNDRRNHIAVFHKDDGNLSVQIRDFEDSIIINQDLGIWSPTSGTSYEAEFNYDLDIGEQRLFIDGVQFGSTLTGIGTRDANINLLRVGSSYIGTSTSDFDVEDLIVYSEVQHTSNYTPGYSLEEERYLESVTIYPEFETDLNRTISSLTGFGISPETTGISFNLKAGNGDFKYWNGSSWVIADGTKNNSNIATEINANLSSYTDIKGATNLTIKHFFNESGDTQYYIDLLGISYEESTTTIGKIRDLLEGYCIDESVISNNWINDRLNNYVIPVIIEGKLNVRVDGEYERVAYINGTGKSILILPDKNVLEIISIEYVNTESVYTPSLANFILIGDEGILKAKYNFNESWVDPVFPKGTRNIKITYTIGYNEDEVPVDLNELICYLTVLEILDWIEGRSGGGNTSSENFSRDYGDIGKYSNIRRRVTQKCNTIIRRYRSAVV